MPMFLKKLLYCYGSCVLVGCAHVSMRDISTANHHMYATTDDGWELALHHYTPTRFFARKHPVVLCHGIGANRFNWDLPGGPSLAKTLAYEGYDVWLVELRGSGFSRIPKGHTRSSISFDDHVFHDAPAIVRTVSMLSPHGKIHWIGHSMGGMVMYGYLGRLQDERVVSLTAVGSPPYFKSHSKQAGAVKRWVQWANPWLGWFPTQSLGRLGAFTAHKVPLESIHMVWNPENMAPQDAQHAALWVLEDIPVKVAVQVASVGMEHESLAPMHKLFDYTESLKNIQTPTHLVAGMVDGLAPVHLMQETYAQLGSQDKTLSVIAKSRGASNDYGHADMALGKNASLDVFMPVIKWINQHDVCF
jgi:pimeloyl-ACP methyl ester carboxylesterase